MSTEESVTPNGALQSATEIPILDVSKLHSLPSEQQDLFILTFVYDFRHAIHNLAAESLPHQQPLIKKEAIKVIGLASPVPSRPLRIAIASALADSFGRGSRSLLFETINELLAILNQGKIDKEAGPKHVAIVCLGELFQAAGDSAVSLSGLVVQSLIKASKASYVGIRGSALRSLSLVVGGLGSSIDEHVARDVWKASRNAASKDMRSILCELCVVARSTSTIPMTLMHYNRPLGKPWIVQLLASAILWPKHWLQLLLRHSLIHRILILRYTGNQRRLPRNKGPWVTMKRKLSVQVHQPQPQNHLYSYL
jgi:hypothetical protein